MSSMSAAVERQDRELHGRASTGDLVEVAAALSDLVELRAVCRVGTSAPPPRSPPPRARHRYASQREQKKRSYSAPTPWAPGTAGKLDRPAAAIELLPLQDHALLRRAISASICSLM